jgi:ribosomal protein S18 acetylase RimI-like enzyme
MQRTLDNIPESNIGIPLELLTARHLGIEAFVKFFMECFHDSKDRDASLIAADIKRTEQFIEHLIEQEGKHRDPDGWIVAFMQDKFAGFAIAIEQRNNGLIAEVGVAPHFRKRGIGTWLSIKGIQRLKDRGFKQAFLGVDIQNIPAIKLYEKLGFKKLPEEIFELQKRII